MKKYRILQHLVMIFIALISFSNSSAQNQQKAVIQTTLYCDHCKECETCGANFKDNMLKIKGVRMYELDEEKMTITVFYNPKKTELTTIKNAIAKMGYDADEVKATPDAYERLDACCKKS